MSDHLECEKVRKSFILHLKSGTAPIYKKRHTDVWPEMRKMLQEAGIFNYTIWLEGDIVFGYYETYDMAFADSYKSRSDIQHKWSQYMADIVQILDNGQLNIIVPECVFLLD